jgi:diguanylate cyclase (GGDEF)-like protein
MDIDRGPELFDASAAVLGRLLVIQQAIDAMPDDTRLAAFVRRALADIPGIADAHVHLKGSTTAPSPAIAALLERCNGGATGTPEANLQRSIGHDGYCFPIHAPGQHFGCLVVQTVDERAFRPYRDFLGNISSTISRVLASRLYLSRLEQLNQELRASRDCLELRVAERTRELEYRATHDLLTGLANRPLLIDRLQAAMSHARRDGTVLVVVYLDLDSFSFMNTGLGNAAGDAFLLETAQRLCRVVPDCDAVARIGSDEFVILLVGLEGVERSATCLHEMLAAVRAPVRLAGKEVVVTASIGASVFPSDGEDPELLLRRANSAMHRAKRSGKDGVQFYASTRDAAVAERMELEAELREAIPAGELVLHYQPKLDLRSGAWRGAEALVRWQHPRRGLLFPAEFIPLAEESALIVALGEHVLAQACREAARWHRDGLQGKSVAVNVAARQLRDRRIVDLVREVLADTGLDPGCLELEITESSIMHDLAFASSLMRELKALGVSISIDDFGTGYSSLSALRNFPVDKLKIDRSFVHEVETDQSAAAVALAVISFARTLGMCVNAEGVETPGQACFLRQHACDEIQGYLLSRPLPAAELEALYRRGDPPPWHPHGT